MTGAPVEPKTRLTASEITAFLNEVFPGAMERFVIEDVQSMRARVRMKFDDFQPSAVRR